MARNQQATALELRAALSLSRLWQQQGKRDQAHLRRLTCKEAKTLLQDLAT